MFRVSPARHQTFIDTPNCVLEDRVQGNTVQILIIFSDSYLQIMKFVGTVHIH